MASLKSSFLELGLEKVAGGHPGTRLQVVGTAYVEA